MNQIDLASASTVVCEGDSLTAFRLAPLMDSWAWSRLTGAQYGYPERVGDWVFCHRPELRLTIRNAAIAGSTMADLVARFDLHLSPLKPAVVVFTIGTNDCARGIPLQDFSRDVSTYAHRLRDLCGGRLLFLGGLGPIPGCDPGSSFQRPELPQYMQAAASAVIAGGGIVVDAGAVLAEKAAILRQLWSGHTLFHDGTHFGPVGHEILAGLVLQSLGLMHLPAAGVVGSGPARSAPSGG